MPEDKIVFKIPPLPEAMPVENIRISVCIPCYNLGELLIETVKSVQAQSFPVHEIILVNDGSTDNTHEIVQNLPQVFTYLNREKNQGVSQARNLAAEHASGNWFLFLDGDDHLFPDALAHFSKSAAEGGAGVIVGRVEQLDPETGQRRERTYPEIGGAAPHASKKNFWRSLIASPGAALVNADLHRAIGGYTKPWQPTEDRDYYIRSGACTTYRFCDAFVLEKIYRENSVRIYSRQAVFWGAKVQMEFLDWAAERGIATDYLETTPLEIILRNLKEALKNHDLDVVASLKGYAVEKGVSLPLPWKIRCGLEKLRSLILPVPPKKQLL